jgi:hypothetical protein
MKERGEGRVFGRLRCMGAGFRRATATVVLAGVGMVCGCAAPRGGAAEPARVEPARAARLAAVEATDDGVYRVGTNRLTLAEATNYLARIADRIDAVAVRGTPSPAEFKPAHVELIRRLLRLDVPVLVVEEDGVAPPVPPPPAPAGGAAAEPARRELRLSTDQLQYVLQTVRQGAPQPAATAETPALRSTLRWDDAQGQYELHRIEFGMPGRHLWIVHELGADNERGVTGVRLQREW